jgi:hypothetical protein
VTGFNLQRKCGDGIRKIAPGVNRQGFYRRRCRQALLLSGENA